MGKVNQRLPLNNTFKPDSIIRVAYICIYVYDDDRCVLLFSFPDSLTAIMKTYGWSHTSIMFDYPLTIFNLAGGSLVKDFRDSPHMANPFEITFDGTKATDADYMAFLKEAALRSRGNLINMIKKNVVIWGNILHGHTSDYKIWDYLTFKR